MKNKQTKKQTKTNKNKQKQTNKNGSATTRPAPQLLPYIKRKGSKASSFYSYFRLKIRTQMQGLLF